MKVLIVGCGYVGRPLGQELARQGHKVFGVCRTSESCADLTQTGISPLQADVTRSSDLAKLPGPFDWVVGTLASQGGSPEDYRQVYLGGIQHLLRWLNPSPPKKFVYTSSTSVYGQNDGSCVEETSATKPLTETGQILLQTEQLLLEAARTERLPVVILRVAGIYGPGRGHHFRQLLNGRARIAGSGGRHLNMIHRDDVVGALMAALHQGCPGEIYNAVDDRSVTQLEFFRWLADALGKEMPPRDPEGEDSDRKRGLTDKQVQNRKLRNELGYVFKYPTFCEGYAEEIRRLGGES